MTKQELSYIAGFLDGDGCVMLQLVYRHDYVLGYQIRASIVFYQNSRYKLHLKWLRSKFKYGYIRERNDGMSEYTIVGFDYVVNILKFLYPYLKLKRPQADLVMEIYKMMPKKHSRMDPKHLLKLAKEVDKFSKLNYSKKRTNTSVQVKSFLKSHNLLIP